MPWTSELLTCLANACSGPRSEFFEGNCECPVPHVELSNCRLQSNISEALNPKLKAHGDATDEPPLRVPCEGGSTALPE